MPEDIPPRNDIGSQGLGSVPMKPDLVPKGPEVPIGGGSTQTRVITGIDTRPKIDPSTVVVPVASSKPVIVGLSIAVAGLAAFSGYESLQARDLQGQLVEADNQSNSAAQANKSLESDLKIAREGLASQNEAHESVISEKDRKLKEALAKAEEKSDELAKQAEENKELLVKIEAADAAIQEKAFLDGQLAELKNSNQELANEKAKAEEEVQRLAGEVEKRNSTPSSPSIPVVPKTTPKKSDRTRNRYEEETESPVRRQPRNTRAWVRLGKYMTGKNKGHWYYVAPNGFVSSLYGSRELAIRNAELRAGLAPGSGGESSSAK